MPDPFIHHARLRLNATSLELARQLDVTNGCLRRWERRGAPRYVKLALAALIAGLEPETGRKSRNAGTSADSIAIE